MPEEYRWPVPGRYAVLNPASPRAPGWVEAFGGLVAPVRSTSPTLMGGPEGPLPMLIVAAMELPAAMLRRAIQVHARKLGCSESYALADMLGPSGMPILADDVVACNDPADGIAVFAPGGPAHKGGAA